MVVNSGFKRGQVEACTGESEQEESPLPVLYDSKSLRGISLHFVFWLKKTS